MHHLNLVWINGRTGVEYSSHFPVTCAYEWAWFETGIEDFKVLVVL